MSANGQEDNPDKVESPYVKSGVVTCDEEVWIQDRILTAVRQIKALERAKHVGADERSTDDGIEGVVNGTAIEIINHLGLQTEGENLRLKEKRDEILQYDGGDDS
jgi:hypothetical protein